MLRVQFQLTVFLVLIALGSYGQQLHFSDYDHAPQILSPALAGAFYGSYRVGTTLREQYKEFIFQPYQSANVYVDTPQAFGLSERHWIGLSMALTKNEAGNLSMNETRVVPGIAYHRALDKKFRSFIGIGVQYALASRQVDSPEAFSSEDELLGLVDASQDRDLLSNFNGSYAALNSGIYFRTRVNRKTEFETGFAVMNLLNKGYRFSGSTYENKQGVQYNVHTQLWVRSKTLTINPSIVVHTRQGLLNMMPKMRLEHLLDKKKRIYFNYALGYRLNDALLFGVGARYNGWSVGLNYDMTLSSAQTYNGHNGAFELGVYKIFTIYPKAKNKVIQICPRL